MANVTPLLDSRGTGVATLATEDMHSACTCSGRARIPTLASDAKKGTTGGPDGVSTWTQPNSRTTSTESQSE